MSRLSYGVPLESFEQLEDYLVNWRSFYDEAVYDPAGMMALLSACIKNLRTHVTSEEITEFGDGLSDDERSFLKALSHD